MRMRRGGTLGHRRRRTEPRRACNSRYHTTRTDSSRPTRKRLRAHGRLHRHLAHHLRRPLSFPQRQRRPRLSSRTCRWARDSRRQDHKSSLSRLQRFWPYRDKADHRLRAWLSKVSRKARSSSPRTLGGRHRRNGHSRRRALCRLRRDRHHHTQKSKIRNMDMHNRRVRLLPRLSSNTRLHHQVRLLHIHNSKIARLHQGRLPRPELRHL